MSGVEEPPTPVLQFRAVSSSEEASLHGQKAKTPIIAGSICGGVMGLAWIIGFAIYFRKRYRRKLRNEAIATGQLPPESKEPEEQIFIPPDPAVLMGHPPGKLAERSPSSNPSNSVGPSLHTSNAGDGVASSRAELNSSKGYDPPPNQSPSSL